MQNFVLECWDIGDLKRAIDPCWTANMLWDIGATVYVYIDEVTFTTTSFALEYCGSEAPRRGRNVEMAKDRVGEIVEVTASRCYTYCKVMV